MAYISNPGATLTFTAGNKTVNVAGTNPILEDVRGGDLAVHPAGALPIASRTATTITLVLPAPANATLEFNIMWGPSRSLVAQATATTREVWAQITAWADRGLSIPVIAVQNAPPSTPADGDRYLVGTAGSGAWAGNSNRFATWSATSGRWEFTVPVAGWAATINGSLVRLQFTGTAWGATSPIAGTTTVGGRLARFIDTAGGLGQSLMSEDGSGNVTLGGKMLAVPGAFVPANAGVANAAYTALGTYGGGYVLADGSLRAGLWMQNDGGTAGLYLGAGTTAGLGSGLFVSATGAVTVPGTLSVRGQDTDARYARLAAANTFTVNQYLAPSTGAAVYDIGAIQAGNTAFLSLRGAGRVFLSDGFDFFQQSDGQAGLYNRANADLVIYARGGEALRIGASRAVTLQGRLTAPGFKATDAVASSPSDISKHMDLYGGVYGLSVTSARLNYVVATGNTHNFGVGGSDRLVISGAGVAANTTLSANNGSAAGGTIALGTSTNSILSAATGAELLFNAAGYSTVTAYGIWNFQARIAAVAPSFNPFNSSVLAAAVQSSGAFGGGHMMNDGGLVSASWIQNESGAATYWGAGTGAGVAAYLRMGPTGLMRFIAYGAGTLVTDASGNVTASSTIRLKADVETWGKGLEAVLALKPVSFNWSRASGLDRLNRYHGFIAEDVEEVLPEAVGMDENGDLTLMERPIIGALVNAIKEQHALLQDARARIEALENA